MNDITEANIWEQPNTKEAQLELSEDRQILINNDLPGPVRNTWIRIKDKELQIKRERQDNNIYIQQYQLRDTNLEIINFINYTWQDLRLYNLDFKIIALFKKRLLRLYSYLK
jgi:hypothetical protein